MTTDIKAPAFPESISEGTVAGWLKAPGDVAHRDEVLVEIETDKVVLEVVAPEDGTLVEILVGEGETVVRVRRLAHGMADWITTETTDIRVELGPAEGARE